mmetsp:Transcript_29739/g.63244  ORF Transcript_29739/g.63244 Transcript_29739/m.63244 type:complete len:86 (-) Transcript_29739:249-506(-)
MLRGTTATRRESKRVLFLLCRTVQVATEEKEKMEAAARSPGRSHQQRTIISTTVIATDIILGQRRHQKGLTNLSFHVHYDVGIWP